MTIYDPTTEFDSDLRTVESIYNMFGLFNRQEASAADILPALESAADDRRDWIEQLDDPEAKAHEKAALAVLEDHIEAARAGDDVDEIYRRATTARDRTSDGERYGHIVARNAIDEAAR